MFVLSGTNAEGEDSHTVAAMIFDDCQVADNLSQDAIEVDQFLDFAVAAQARGELPSIETYRKPESDPPDLLVKVRGREHGVELTSISTPEVSRQRLSEIRMIGRDLADLVKRESQRFTHLVGTRIILQELASDAQRPPKSHRRTPEETIVSRLADALGPSIGVVDRSPLLPLGSPVGTVVTAEVANRGRARIDDSYLLEVHASADATAPPNVVANCQVELVDSLLIKTLLDRVQRKDREGTEFLLVTTGLPDKAGYVCPADGYVFELLRRLAFAGRITFPSLRYIRQIVLNHWRYPPWTLVFADGDGLLHRTT